MYFFPLLVNKKMKLERKWSEPFVLERKPMLSDRRLAQPV